MKKRILEILSYVMKEIQETSVDDIDLQLIVDLLEEQGFSEEDISHAMTWLLQHGESIDRIIPEELGLPRPIWRQLNESESEAISPGAFSYLFRLRELELLNDDLMEKIIERATSLQMSQLTIEEMQDLIAAVVLDFESNTSQGFFQFTSNRLPH